jgi:hypothetical protein
MGLMAALVLGGVEPGLAQPELEGGERLAAILNGTPPEFLPVLLTGGWVPKESLTDEAVEAIDSIPMPRAHPRSGVQGTPGAQGTPYVSLRVNMHCHLRPIGDDGEGICIRGPLRPAATGDASTLLPATPEKVLLPPLTHPELVELLAEANPWQSGWPAALAAADPPTPVAMAEVAAGMLLDLWRFKYSEELPVEDLRTLCGVESTYSPLSPATVRTLLEDPPGWAGERPDPDELLADGEPWEALGSLRFYVPTGQAYRYTQPEIAQYLLALLSPDSEPEEGTSVFCVEFAGALPTAASMGPGIDHPSGWTTHHSAAGAGMIRMSPVSSAYDALRAPYSGPVPPEPLSLLTSLAETSLVPFLGVGPSRAFESDESLPASPTISSVHNWFRRWGTDKSPILYLASGESHMGLGWPADDSPLAQNPFLGWGPPMQRSADALLELLAALSFDQRSLVAHRHTFRADRLPERCRRSLFSSLSVPEPWELATLETPQTEVTITLGSHWMVRTPSAGGMQLQSGRHTPGLHHRAGRASASERRPAGQVYREWIADGDDRSLTVPDLAPSADPLPDAPMAMGEGPTTLGVVRQEIEQSHGVSLVLPDEMDAWHLVATGADAWSVAEFVDTLSAITGLAYEVEGTQVRFTPPTFFVPPCVWAQADLADGGLGWLATARDAGILGQWTACEDLPPAVAEAISSDLHEVPARPNSTAPAPDGPVAAMILPIIRVSVDCAASLEAVDALGGMGQGAHRRLHNASWEIRGGHSPRTPEQAARLATLAPDLDVEP